MKLQHNSRGESSEDLIALIIVVQRERDRKAGGEKTEGREAEEKKVGEKKGVMQTRQRNWCLSCMLQV